MKSRKERVFDQGVDYEDARRRCIEEMRDARANIGPDADGWVDETQPARLLHLSTFLVQLTNGSRGTEAAAATSHWVETQERGFSVRVLKTSISCTCGHSKRKVPRNPNSYGHEKMVKDKDGNLPPGFSFEGERGRCLHPDCPCQKYVEDPKKVEYRPMRIPVECLDSDLALYKQLPENSFTPNAYKLWVRRHFINSHSARYSLITMLDAKGYTEASISKVTGHQNPSEIRTYLQKKKGVQILDALAAGKEVEAAR